MEFLVVVAVDVFFSLVSLYRSLSFASFYMYILFCSLCPFRCGAGVLCVSSAFGAGIPAISFSVPLLTHAIQNKLFCCTKPKKQKHCVRYNAKRSCGDMRWDAEHVIWFFYSLWPVLCSVKTQTQEHEDEVKMKKKKKEYILLVALAHDSVVVLFGLDLWPTPAVQCSRRRTRTYRYLCCAIIHGDFSSHPSSHLYLFIQIIIIFPFS